MNFSKGEEILFIELMRVCVIVTEIKGTKLVLGPIYVISVW